MNTSHTGSIRSSGMYLHFIRTFVSVFIDFSCFSFVAMDWHLVLYIWWPNKIGRSRIVLNTIWDFAFGMKRRTPADILLLLRLECEPNKREMHSNIAGIAAYETCVCARASARKRAPAKHPYSDLYIDPINIEIQV